MEFDTLVLKIIGPVLNNYGYEEKIGINQVSFILNDFYILINYDEREKSNSVYFGKYPNLYPLNEKVIKNLFLIDIHLQNLPIKEFLENLKDFFINNGSLLVAVDEPEIRRFIEETHILNKKYTDNLINEQNLALAEIEWEKGNYLKFLFYVGKLENLFLKESFKLKIHIAKSKIYKGAIKD